MLVQHSRMYNIEESGMYSTYDCNCTDRKIQCVHKTFFNLQFHNCYLLSEYKLLLKQCRILCHLRLWKRSKSAILNFWAIAGFEESRMWYIWLYCTNQKIVNVATNGAYDLLHWHGELKLSKDVGWICCIGLFVNLLQNSLRLLWIQWCGPS